ncbi:excalibur calcium-binding domain-containing protein [Aldersonia sp. NBC_00410]|uniref:excalibur calcium-binding domain-containing protein n=1 Tax=Aldersonia sp. NBC_00410 TaxID=2975954 RepID=UPI0022514E76|nr:excalibur calcium-binding domain-containing protein [Aldersonia sp. NBC_00410]MCX5042189.1 excalibur calcium-binding domain-containing protein [Aldersonia sp. NBC_00410]
MFGRRARRFGLAAVGLTVAAAVMTPAGASADPVNDVLCAVGSSAPEFCLAAPPPPGPTPPRAVPPPLVTPYTYQNCTQARIAGVAPIHRWEPGYSRRLDPDNDGVACEY